MKQIFPETTSGLLQYEIAEGVTAFSPLRNAVLPMHVVQAHQVHGDRIATVTSGNLDRTRLEGYDALVTDIPGIAIAARTADCIPVLMYDPVHRAIAAVHSGWKGTVLKIAQKTIELMADLYGTLPKDIFAVIGPGIGPDSFQVGREVTEAFLSAGFPEKWTPDFPQGHTRTRTSPVPHKGHTPRNLQADPSAAKPMSGPAAIPPETIPIIMDHGPKIPGSMAGGLHIDLWQANRWMLTEAGVPDDRVFISGIDTYTNTCFFSARREGASCGRTINTIMLDP